MTATGKVYSHSGDCGDLIYALSTLPQLGGGRLVLFPAACSGWRMKPRCAASLRPLLEAQHYVEGVEWAEEPRGINLDKWRWHYTDDLNIADMVADTFGVPHYPRELP